MEEVNPPILGYNYIGYNLMTLLMKVEVPKFIEVDYS